MHILCIGAHCDDIEIGCGGTMLRLLGERPACRVTWVVFSSNTTREKEAMSCAELFTRNTDKATIIVKAFRNGFFPYIGTEIKEYIESLKADTDPDLIFTHYRHDLHQDHRLLSELTWNTFRNHMIFEYEIPKYDGDLGTPNFFVPLSEDICTEKVENILNCYETQTEKHWFERSTFMGLMRLRGMECHSDSRYAEAFHCRKITL